MCDFAHHDVRDHSNFSPSHLWETEAPDCDNSYEQLLESNNVMLISIINVINIDQFPAKY